MAQSRLMRLHALMTSLATVIKSSGARLVLVKRNKFDTMLQLKERLLSSAVPGTRHTMPTLAVCINQAFLQWQNRSTSGNQGALLILPRAGHLPPVQLTLALDDTHTQVAIARTATQKVCLDVEARSCIICSQEQPSKVTTCGRCWCMLCYNCTVKTMQHCGTLGALRCPMCRQEQSVKVLVSDFMPQDKVAWHPGPYAALFSALKDCRPRKLFIIQPSAPSNGVYETAVHLTANRTIGIPGSDVDVVNRLLYGKRCLMLLGESSTFAQGYFVVPQVHAFFVDHSEAVHDVSHISDLLHMLRLSMM